jgi:GDP-D-mannose dehydratase
LAGRRVEEKGVEATGQVLVEVDPRYFRPTEVDTLLGDRAGARQARLAPQDELRPARQRHGGRRHRAIADLQTRRKDT